MSANINVLNPEKPKKIALIAANPSVNPTTGWPVGFWWAELTHPYLEFTEKGYKVDIFSPEGGDLTADGFSDPEDESGYSSHDIISLGFKKSKQHSELLKNTKSIKAITPSNYDAIFLTGGQSPMFTFINNNELHNLVLNFYEAGKPLGIVCHATCVLLKVKNSDGKLLADGKTWTGFSDAEEQYAENFVDKKYSHSGLKQRRKKILVPTL